tara:strand:+ start:107 stop:547 length:441 start_codon:yes stop_codon:yes gene_type:complete
MAGLSGWMVKMWGIMILASTWILIFMMLVSAGNGGGNGSSNGTGDSIGSIYDALTAFALIHALGFSLIALGWRMEYGEIVPNNSSKNAYGEILDKRAKLNVPISSLIPSMDKAGFVEEEFEFLEWPIDSGEYWHRAAGEQSKWIKL